MTSENNDSNRALTEGSKRLLDPVRDPADMLSARKRMDQMREAIFQKYGTLNIAVDLIREARGECGDPSEHPAVSEKFIESLNRLRVTAEQMDRLIRALNDLKDTVLPRNPQLFAMMAEAPLDDLENLRRDINRYALELSFIR
jgi:hypothetical protein